MNKFMSIVCDRIKVRLIRTFKKVQLSPKNKSKTELDIDPYFRDLSNFCYVLTGLISSVLLSEEVQF